MEELNLPESELEAAVNTETAETTISEEFYVVSIRKFYTLYVLTFGLYSIYWFYKNWALQKKANGFNCWPVPRAIFSIFFTHSLFRNIDKKLHPERSRYNNELDSTATLVVIAAILENISSRLSDKNIGSPATDIFVFVMAIARGLLLAKAQKSINLACNDPLGSSNNKFSVANIIWMTLGAICWLLAFIGVFGEKLLQSA